MSNFVDLLSSDDDADEISYIKEEPQSREVRVKSSPSPKKCRIWGPCSSFSTGACGTSADLKLDFINRNTQEAFQMDSVEPTFLQSTPRRSTTFQKTQVCRSCPQPNSNKKNYENLEQFVKSQFEVQNTVLKECLSLLREIHQDRGKKPNSSKKMDIQVPAHIKQSVRNGYKYNERDHALQWITKTAAGITLKYTSEQNKEMTDGIIRYVKGQFPSAEEGIIRCGEETYFNSIKQKRLMEDTGTKNAHNRKMVLYGRKNRKLQNRRKMLKENKLKQEEEERMMNSLQIDFMSSEDSDSEDDSVFITRPLNWLSPKYKEFITRLDKRYNKNLNAQGKRLKSKRIVGQPSERQPPLSKPPGTEWVFA